MSWRGAGLVPGGVGLLAGFTVWAAPEAGRSARTPSTVTLATGPAGLTVTDLHQVGRLRRWCNAGQGHPRLVLGLAPTGGVPCGGQVGRPQRAGALPARPAWVDVASAAAALLR